MIFGEMHRVSLNSNWIAASDAISQFNWLSILEMFPISARSLLQIALETPCDTSNPSLNLDVLIILGSFKEWVR